MQNKLKTHTPNKGSSYFIINAAFISLYTCVKKPVSRQKTGKGSTVALHYCKTDIKIV